MHILFLTHYFWPEGNAPAARVHAMARHWVEQGHRVTVITGAPNVPDGIPYEGYKNKFRPQRDVVDGIEVIRIWTWIAANAGIVWRILNYLSFMWSARIFIPKSLTPDILIATSPQFYCGWAGIFIARRLGVPFVLEVRDLWPDAIVAVGARIPHALLGYIERMERKLYAAATHIVTVADCYRDKLVEKGVPEAAISIVSNGFDADIFTSRQPSAELAAELGIQDTFVCSYIGTVGMACHLETALDAAARLRKIGRKDISFLIVGNGACKQSLETEAKRRGLDNVHIIGRVPRERVPDYLALSDAALIHLRPTPLFESVIPSKIFEAAGMGVPLLMGVAGAAARWVETAQCGICFPPGDADGLARALTELVDHPNQAHVLGAAGQAYVLRNYSRATLANYYLDILAKIITDSEPAPHTQADTL